MNCLRVALLVVIFIFHSSNESFSSSSNKFNQLILSKSSLESKFGVRSVECFPFKENIGFTEDQIQLIERCLTGVQAFESALSRAVSPQTHSVGISTRFLRTGGFNTILIPWDASSGEIVSFLKEEVSKTEQEHFLEKILTLNPNNLEVEHGYGVLLLKLNQHSKGLNHIRKGTGFIRFTSESYKII